MFVLGSLVCFGRMKRVLVKWYKKGRVYMPNMIKGSGSPLLLVSGV